MQDIKKLLDKRNSLKKKKPLFRRKEIYRKKKLAIHWRRARGLDNKQRLNKRGAPPTPSNGYRSPKAVRGLHHSGLVPIVVSNLAQLSSLTKENGIILSANLGNRKRQLLINEIKKIGFTIINLDADETLTKIRDGLKQRKTLRMKKLEEQKDKKKAAEDKVKKEKEAAKEAAKEEAKPKQDEQKKEETPESDEEKKKQEKEEKDKLLIKRE